MDVSRARELILQQAGLDPETDEFNADVVETGTSKHKHERIQSMKRIIREQEVYWSASVPIVLVIDEVPAMGIDESKAHETLQKTA